MSDKVFLHYTQAELDRNFDQRGWVTNADEVIARYRTRSSATRATLEHRPDVRYGPGADELLDIFPASRPDAPVQVFIHGGAWRNFGKADFSFAAEPFVAAGVHAVVLNFSKLPAIRLPDLVAQVRRGVEWVYRNAEGFGGDRRRIYVTGHSSGAYLAAMTLLSDWARSGLPNDLVKGAACISGQFDLEPVVLSARGSYVKLSGAEVRELSPQHQVDRLKGPVVLAYAEHDTDEFQRQTRSFAAALESVGRLSAFLRLPALNHFEIIEALAPTDGPLVGAILAQMGLESLESARTENGPVDRVE